MVKFIPKKTFSHQLGGVWHTFQKGVACVVSNDDYALMEKKILQGGLVDSLLVMKDADDVVIAEKPSLHSKPKKK